MKALLFLVLSISYEFSFAAGKIYSWRDEEGNLHFGDKAPSANAQQVDIKPTTSSDVSGKTRFERTKKLVDSLADERAERDEARLKEKQARKQKQRDCLAAQAEFREMSDAQFLYREGDGDDKQILSFEERARAEQNAREKMRKLCGEN